MDSSMLILRRCVALAASLGVAPMSVFAASDNGTITIGSASNPLVCHWGYFGAIGAYSPTGLSGGKTLEYLATILIGPSCTGVYNSLLGVGGFSSDPGQGWLISVTCDGITRTGGTASYNYSSPSGEANWTWTGVHFGFPLNIGSQLGCTIVHN